MRPGSEWPLRRPIARRPPRFLRSSTCRRPCSFTPMKNTNRRWAALAAATPKSPLRVYAAYYAGVSEPRLSRFDAARRRFEGLKETQGFVGEAAALGEAEAAHAMGEFDDAAKIYEDILDEAALDVPAVWLSLANAALADGDRRRAAEAFLRLDDEFPLSEYAVQAEGPLQTLSEVQPITTGNTRYKLEMGRGERLFGSRRYPEARNSFLRLKPFAESETDAEVVSLRLAEIDVFPGALRQRERRAAAVPDKRRPAGRGAFLLPDVRPRAAQ